MLTPSQRTTQPQDLAQSDYHEAFQQMLKAETDLWPEYFVFYHSYSSHPLLYEVYAALAHLAYGVDVGAPLPRLLHKGFKRYPTLQTLVAKWPGSDHHRYVKRVLISAQPTLFSTLECQPVAHFPTGYCSTPPFTDSRGVEQVLKACGCPSAVVQEILGLWKVSYTPTKGPQGPPQTGHMLQIFVHRTAVDDVAYPSAEYGRIAKQHLPLSKFLCGETVSAVVQARVFVHPTYFLNRAKVELRYYCAEPSFDRAAFALTLRRLLHRRLRIAAVQSVVPQEPFHCGLSRRRRLSLTRARITSPKGSQFQTPDEEDEKHSAAQPANPAHGVTGALRSFTRFLSALAHRDCAPRPRP
jgi:hypothetical protein